MAVELPFIVFPTKIKIVDGDNDGDSDTAITSENDSHSEEIALVQTSLDGFHENLKAAEDPLGCGSSTQNNLPFRADDKKYAPFRKLWHKHWLGADDRALLLDAAGLKLLKFLLVTAACLVAVHSYAIFVNDKHDPTYDLRKMVVYDGKPIVLDCIVFFVVGRLYEAASVDSLRFVVPLIGTALLQSWGATHFHNVQKSITPYQIKCEWTWHMYLLVMGGCLPLLGGLLVAHSLEVRKRGIHRRAVAEFVLSVVFFLLPSTLLSEDGRFFHVHHWYYAWFLGMHCNLHGKWWSELAMSILWGIYVNGVAIYGRDPIMTCSMSLYRSQSQECPYLGEGMGYGQYTLEDLARDSGLYDAVEGTSSAAIVCPADVTRWLSSSW